MEPPAQSGSSALPRRRLGSTGYEVVCLGIGTGALGADPQAQSPADEERIAVATLRRAFELGLNYVDTSPSYRFGASETYAGKALLGGWRDRVILATKAGTHPARAGDYSAEAVHWTVEQSRRSLNTDLIDVLLLHDPNNIEVVLAAGGAVDAMEDLKRKGVIGAIGLAVQNHAFLRAAIESRRFDVIQSPYDFNLLRNTAAPLVATAAERGVGFINASPFQQGLLAGIDPEEIVRVRTATRMWAARDGDLERARQLWRWSQQRGADLRAMAIQFCLRETRIATTLTGPRNPTEIAQDVESATGHVPSELWRALADLLPQLSPPSPGGEAAVGAFPPA